jgi:hypothetical protein
VNGQALDHRPSIEGILSALVVDASTGHVLTTLRIAGADDAAIVAAAATDIVHVVSLMTAHLAADDDLEELIITLSGHHHMVRPLPAPEEECLFLLVSFDRDQVNLALARHHLQALEAQVIAQITTQGVA